MGSNHEAHQIVAIAVTTPSLPEQLKANLPTIEQLDIELDAAVSELSE